MYIPKCYSATCDADATVVLSLHTIDEGEYLEFPYCDADIKYFSDALQRFNMKVRPL